MNYIWIISFSFFFLAYSAGAETIMVVADRVNEESSYPTALGTTLSPSVEANDFYQELNLLPFIQSRGNSFINQEDSLRFMGQSSGQLLVLEDGLSQQSSTGIGGSRSYHFLDPFFYTEIKTHVGGSVSSIGSGAFSGALEFISDMRPREKYQLTTGSFGFQKMAYQKVFKKSTHLWSMEFLRSFKSGPSLRPSSSGAAEEDSRELSVIRIKWKENQHSELGQYLQVNYFSDRQDFDQFTVDDDRPYSNEFSGEIIYKNNQIVFNKYFWKSVLRLQNNQREVNNVFGDQVNLLTYKSTNLFLRTDIEMLDFHWIDNFHAGLDLSHDLYLNLTEVQSAKDPTLFQASIFTNAIKKEKNHRYRFSGRLEHVQNTFLPTGKIGYDFTKSGAMLSLQVSNNTRQPSFYELYSVYGNENLKAEKNISVESSVSRKLNGGTFQLLGFAQYMKELIHYNNETFRYENIHKNNLYGVGANYQQLFGSFELNISSSLTKSANQLAQIGISPIKISAIGKYQFNSKFNFAVEEVHYNERTIFGGEILGATLFSKVSAQYQYRPSLIFNASVQGDYQAGVVRNKFFRFGLTGSL